MKDFLLTKTLGIWQYVVYPMVVLMMLGFVQLNAQQCDPEIDGDAYVCPSTESVYIATRGEVGSTLSWSLSGGGTLVSLENDNTTATIQWDGVSGGPFMITVTETGTACSETTQLEVLLEETDVTLACNDMVNVALDENCEAVITADMILEDPQYGDDSYTIHLSDQNWQPIPGNTVDIQYLNEVINVTIEHNCSGNTCWGKIAVQDNIAPGLECRSDTIEIACDESYAPENVGFPLPPAANKVKIANNEYSVVVPGDCGGAYSLVFSDEVVNMNCGDPYDYLVNRTWIATDESGNSTSCEETIGAVWGSLNNMTLPPHYDGLLQYVNHLPKLQCSFAGLPYYWPHEYNPGPDVTGYPEWSGCSNIQYYYEDVVFPICGNSRKIVRHWLILDWCTGADFAYDQLIIIVDDAGPVVTAVRDTLYYGTDPGKCYGTAYPIPAPIVLFDCSGYDYTISYKLRDESGQPAENAITDNVFEGPEGFGISDLPVDTVWVMYTITDECGHSTTAFTEIVIEDYEAPTAVCDKHTVVTLSEEGTAKIYASSIDDGSNDNCELAGFEIRRMDTPCDHPEDLDFGEVVHFCCEDVGETVLVVFRAYDAKGHYSDCMVEVRVDDKTPPEFTYCPPYAYLDCGQDYTDLNLTGVPTVTDNCDNYELDYTDYVNIEDCGTGYVRRDWKVTDANGLSDYCRQYIYIEDNNPLSYDDIDWPEDIELDGCQEVDYHPDVTGWPVLNNVFCKNLGIAYTDQLIHNVEGVCLKILRYWKVADWCEEQPYDYLEYTQVIKISETTDPYFTSCENIVVNSDNATCDALVTVTANADDDCTPAEDLEYSWQIDYDRDGSIDESGVGDAFSRTFPHGRHWVHFTVTDGCGNYSTCRITVRVKDTKDPTPICLAKVTTTMMSTGMVPIWASSFNLCQCSSGSFDNCTPKEDLRFSFSSNVNDTMRIFTCDDIPNGVAESFALEMWVTDLDGNQDFCNVTLVIMDNVQVCDDAPDASASLSGLIIDEKQRGMPEFQVELEQDDSFKEEEVTDAEGQYVFTNLEVYSKYKLKPKKDNDPANGVSTLDLVLIQKHILGLRPLDTPYKLIAADANNTGSVTAGDLLDIRSLILGLNEDYDNSDSWRFINGKYEFENPDAPWDYEDEFVVDELYIGSDSIDFIGVKIGDVNNSAISQMQGIDLEPRSNNSLNLLVDDRDMNAGEQVKVAFRVSEKQMLEGVQFTLDYDAGKILVEQLLSDQMNLSGANVNYFNRGDGLVTMSWNGLSPLEIEENNQLFVLNLVAQQDCRLSEVLNINSAYTVAEAYDDSLEKMDIELRFEQETLQKFTVFQNTPNPFKDETSIRFYLPESSAVKLSIIDNNGKTIHEEEGHYSKGTNSIEITREILGYQGIYFYQLTNGTNAQVKKMVYTR